MGNTLSINNIKRKKCFGAGLFSYTLHFLMDLKKRVRDMVLRSIWNSVHVKQWVQSLTSVADFEPLRSSSNWSGDTSKIGRRFYYNKKVRQTTWKKPFELMTYIERVTDATTSWKEYVQPNGTKYYYNKVSNESQWAIPDELKLVREEALRAYHTNVVNGYTDRRKYYSDNNTKESHEGVDSQSVKLSSAWSEHTSEGRRFYYNKKTRESTWNKPFEKMTCIERIVYATTNWRECTSRNGTKYYYNKDTKKSQWRIPNEFKVARVEAVRARIRCVLASDSSVLSRHKID